MVFVELPSDTQRGGEMPRPELFKERQMTDVDMLKLRVLELEQKVLELEKQMEDKASKEDLRPYYQRTKEN